MNGLKVQRMGRKSARPDATTDFPSFFGPVLAAMISEYWVLVGTEWGIPSGWSEKEGMSYEDYVLEQRGDDRDWFVARPGFMGKFSRFLMDDWCDIFAVAPPPRSLAWYEEHLVTEFERKSKNFDEDVMAWFSCIDGAFWEAFLKDERLLDTLSGHLEGLDGVKWRRVSTLAPEPWR